MTTEQATEQSRAIALRFAQEGWGTNPGWLAVWDEMLATDVVYHFNSAAEPIVGLEANKAFNASLFTGFPDIRHTLEDLLVEKDRAVYRTTLTGTHTGSFLGALPTGRTVKVNDFTLLQISNGKIIQWWYECNLLEVMQQLGLLGNMSPVKE